MALSKKKKIYMALWTFQTVGRKICISQYLTLMCWHFKGPYLTAYLILKVCFRSQNSNAAYSKSTFLIPIITLNFEEIFRFNPYITFLHYNVYVVTLSAFSAFNFLTSSPWRATLLNRALASGVSGPLGAVFDVWGKAPWAAGGCPGLYSCPVFSL